MQYRTEICATRQAVPVFAHPPLLVTASNASCAEIFGARTHKGTSVTTKPPRWPKREMTSIAGNIGAPHVFRTITSTNAANVISVDCQFVKANSELVISSIVPTSVALRNTPPATLASQPSVDIQPAICKWKRLIS